MQVDNSTLHQTTLPPHFVPPEDTHSTIPFSALLPLHGYHDKLRISVSAQSLFDFVTHVASLPAELIDMIQAFCSHDDLLALTSVDKTAFASRLCNLCLQKLSFDTVKDTAQFLSYCQAIQEREAEERILEEGQKSRKRLKPALAPDTTTRFTSFTREHLQAIKALTLTVSDQFTAEQYELLFTYLPRIQHLSIYSYSNRAFHGDVHTLLKAAQPLTLHHLALINLTRYSGDHKDILPNELWQFTTLKTLTIRGFAKLSFIPENIDQLQELTLLDLDFSNLDGVIPHRIRKLPDSLWRLKKLEKLILRNLIRVEIPESIGQLSALKSLTLEDMHLLKMLPSSLWRLNKLESLTLNNLEITALPEEMGQLKALKSLTLKSMHYLKALPASLGQLDNLEVITLESLDNITTLPEAMNQLKAIKVVKLINMKKLGTLPGRLAQLVVRR